MPALIKPEKAPDNNEPEYKIAVLNPNSLRVYQAERKNKQPGKYAASTNPRQNLTATKPP